MSFSDFMKLGFVLIAFGWWATNTAGGIRWFATPRRAVWPVLAMVVGTGLFARGLWLFVRLPR